MKDLPTDLQSVPFNHSGTDPKYYFRLGKEGLEPSRFKKSTDFKSVASTYSATSPPLIVIEKLRDVKNLNIIFKFYITNILNAKNRKDTLLLKIK